VRKTIVGERITAEKTFFSWDYHASLPHQVLEYQDAHTTKHTITHIAPADLIRTQKYKHHSLVHILTQKYNHTPPLCRRAYTHTHTRALFRASGHTEGDYTAKVGEKGF